MLLNPWHRDRLLLWLRVGLILGCLPLLVAAIGLYLSRAQPAQPRLLLLNSIPNSTLLVAHGLSTSPAPDQPTAPIQVERLLYDGQALYLLYRGADNGARPWTPHLPVPPDLYDRLGHHYASIGWTEASGWPADEVLARYPLLVPGIRAISLRLAVPSGGSEIVRLAIPGPLPAWRVSRPRALSTAHGITLTLGRLANSASGAYLTYTLDRPGRSPLYVDQDALQTPSGGAIPLQSPLEQQACTPVGARTRCTVTRTFAPQPAGARLVLSLRAITLPTASMASRIVGPWRVPLVMP